ncbi:hypothetical protein KORDIASMS9_02708 [Kordia sp. SMS9]|nr:hypothetical protein KORDIASMS9_02708 [Kordia sp. SMS9]
MTDDTIKNIDQIKKELMSKHKDSEALRCFIELEIQRTKLNKNDFESLKKAARIVKDKIMNDT